MSCKLFRTITLVAAFISLAITSSARATWSIVIANFETGEVAVGTVTCLNNFDLLAIVPVVVVGKGAAAVQAAGDFNGTRRPVIFDHLQIGTDPEEILVLLAQIGGHQSRQYGIADTQARAITFTGSQASAWAGGVVGFDGNSIYAIQGNILAGDCVVPAIEDAILATDGDIPEKLMAGMEAAYFMGGDGRCSCDSCPTCCGCPPEDFTKAGHIGCMVVARIGDTDDPACNSSGCADGDYHMKFNVPFQSSSRPDPVLQLRDMFDTWRTDLINRPDAIQSTAVLDTSFLPPDGTSTANMTISFLDWQRDLVTRKLKSIFVTHAPDSDGLSSIGGVSRNKDGTYSVEITAGNTVGTDRFRIVVDDGIRPVTLMPEPALEMSNLIDVNVIVGTHLDGQIKEIVASDNNVLVARSGFGETLIDLHNLHLIIDAQTAVATPSTLDLKLETRIDEPSGLAQVKLFNWNTTNFDNIGSFPISEIDTVEILDNIDATDYVNTASNGEIQLSLKQLVFVPFLAFNFDSFIDHVQIRVNE